MTDIELVTKTQPDSFLAEAYRKICVWLSTSLQAGEGQRGRVILLTSALPREGVSTTAANLAAAMAQNDRRTLLLEANFRNPVQMGVFQNASVAQSKDSLGSYLAGEIDSLETLGILENLWLLPAGRKLKHAETYLSGGRMRDLLEELRTQYDCIFLDVPAVLPVPDAMVLAGLADEVVMVVSPGIEAPHVAMEAKKRLLKAGASLRGVVMNRVPHGFDSGYEDYEYYRKM